MEELTRLQTSRRAYRSHVTRIFNKIEDTLTHEIDELAITYLRTAVTQLEKKLDQIVKIDQEICGLIEDANTLEDTIMDSEELQDTITEKINELNKRIELLSQSSSKKSGDDHTVTIPETDNNSDTTSGDCRETVATETSIENIENVSTTNSVSVSSSTSHTPTYTVSAVSTTTTITNTSTAMSTVPLLTPTIFSTSTLSFQPVPSYSISAANPSVSYIHSLGPPPLIPRVTNPSQYGSLPITMDHPLLLPSLSTLNLSTSTSPSLARVPTIEPRANPSLTEVMPTTSSNVTGRTHSQQFTASRLPKLTLPTFSGNPLHWLTFWDSFQAAIHLNPNLSAVQKFNYLKAQVDGDAAKTIEGFPLSDQNYLHAVTILQDRFGQTHKLVAAHMQALLEVASPSNTLTSLRTFHDVINSHSRGLSSLGKSEDTYGDLLVPIILNKLPKETRQNLARDTTTPELTFSQLMAAILKEIRILETSNSTSYKSYSTAAFVVGSKPPRTNKSQDKGPQTCVYCKGTHATNQCTTVVDHQRRLEVVRQNHLCLNCLARHKVSQCTSKFRCRNCKRKHHTSLCNGDNRADVQTQVTTPPVSVPQQNPTTATPVSSYFTPASNRSLVCLLKTAIAPVISGGTRINANILFDEGAQKSFICSELASKLQLIPDTATQVALSSFGANSPSLQTLEMTTIQIQTLNGDRIPVSVLIVPHIATPLQNSCTLELDTLPYLRGLKLANPVSDELEFSVSILIGADHYWSFVQDNIIRGDGPTAQQSRLGYLLSGPLPSPTIQLSTSALLQITTPADQQFNPQEMWSIEAAGTNPELDRDTFLHVYQSSHITQKPDGTYTAKFPWKEDKPHLPSNLDICTRRTKSLVTKLRRHPELLKLYHNIIKDQEQRGFIEQVDDTSNTSNVHYLSHHAVKKNSQTTPIRVVYDCSCRESTQAASLNDCLIVGPSFINDLCAILLRFRLHPFALSTDIEKAFLHVHLDQADRDFTQFLWPLQPENVDSKFQVYRFTSVPFGIASSPFMLNATINLHLRKFHSPISDDIQKNIYVDNIISSCATEDHLIEYYHHSRSILRKAGFNLRSWASNSAALWQVATNDQTIDCNTTVSILGIKWNTATDTMSLAPKPLPSNSLVSKRSILQDSSQIYDPLGWATPVTVRAKILLQDIWQRKCSWDTPLDKDLCDRWLSIRRDIVDLPMVIHSRTYFHQQSGMPDHIYVFADASIKAYGAVAYLHRGSEISPAMSKSRVAPLKALTLPRLELMAAVSASRVAKFVQTSLSPSNTPIPVHLWTDSQIVLHWLRNGSHAQSFVNQRIDVIIQQFPATTWSFTPSEDNPADLLTRGISTTQLRACKLWTCGPDWLPDPTNWPKWTPANVLEIQAYDTVESFTPSEETTLDEKFTGILAILDPSRYSSFHRLQAVAAHVMRAIHNLRNPCTRKLGPLTSSELSSVSKQLIMAVQYSIYKDEIAFLNKSRSHCPTLVKQLRLFTDDSKLLRCGGRIHNAPATDATKFPHLLPPNHQVTKLIVLDVHKRLHHGGVGITVTSLRQMYWIPTIRQYVRRLLRHCVTCRKLMGKPYVAPESPPLPKVRVTEAPPFTITGVDFTGALYVKGSTNGETKVYICLFTCAVTRAVHLEVVSDLTVDTFLLAFRRFVSRKSLPKQLISDNASTYLSAAEELRKMFESDTLKEALASQNISWTFIPKRAPWYGGFWERIIGLTKQAVKKTLGRAFITQNQLETVVVEIEAMLNNRPLTYVSSDLSDPEPLTPSHILYGRRIQSIPFHLEDPEDLSDPLFTWSKDLRGSVDKQKRLVQQFWRRWKREYLTSLREFHKASGNNKQVIRRGDIVIVHDDKPRVQWKLAVVEELIEGRDGMVRAAHIRMDKLKTTRPIVKLYPLEVSEVENQATTADNSEVFQSSEELSTTTRAKRAAALRACQKLTEWADALRAPEDVEN